MNAKKLAVTLLAPLAIGVMTLPQSARGQDQPGGAAPAGRIAVGVVATATVKAIDPAKRTVTLENADGDVRTLKISKDAANFDQVSVGDQVKALAMERLIVSVGKAADAGDAGRASEGPTITRAPKGARPGMIISNTAQMTARITDVDALNRKV